MNVPSIKRYDVKIDAMKNEEQRFIYVRVRLREIVMKNRQ